MRLSLSSNALVSAATPGGTSLISRGGEAQRVSIARTVFNQPEVVLLDEPTSSLDSEAEEDVEKVILRLRQTEEVTAVVVTHDASQARHLCETAVRLEGGRVVDSGDVEKVLR